MTTFEATFSEETGEQRTGSVPLSHLSIELGHLYLDDFRKGPAELRRKFEAVLPWLEGITRHYTATLRGATPRISTCFLVDDYFNPQSPPTEVVPMVLEAAEACGLSIGYLARESACANLPDIRVAEVVTGWIIDEPPEGTNGVRPPATVSGWLSNGQRSPSTISTAAMKGPREWEPPVENARNRHSIFLDVELWSGGGDDRVWSCPFLAVIWQLARLGLLRYQGEAFLQPEPWGKPWPAEWQQLPGVIKIDEGASPFSAYRTMSVLDDKFFPVEHAVRVILSQVSVDATVVKQATLRAEREGLQLPDDPVGRIGYVFTR
ncbi:MAG TPA: SCO2522 family protein [Candidatus Limnocylindrales bacterium]